MPYTGYTALQAVNLLATGQSASFRDAGAAFASAITELNNVVQQMDGAVREFVDAQWIGPAADAFDEEVGSFGKHVNSVMISIISYDDKMDEFARTLDWAKEGVAGLPQRSPIGGTYLNVLAGVYTHTLSEVPTDADDDGEPGNDDKDGKDDDKDEKGDDKDEKGDDKDGKGDEGAGKGDEGAGKGDESAGGSGGGDPAGGGGGGEDPAAGGLGGEDPAAGGGGDLGSGPGGEDLGADGEQPGAGGGVVPGGVTPPLTDSQRALPGAPKATGRDGVTGIDVDGDGRPDLGLDGKPLPDAELVTRDGLTGVDVDGDGAPDIGVDGEILPGAPIVQGPDGTIGIDVNNDGIPDVGISGQILPDAPVVTTDGVRGVDVNGDGVADLGMDRKPLPDAALVTVDGVTGVDVNGDGKPDIGLKGEILSGATMVTGPNGIVGVDVNGDGKPDIAATGGLKADPSSNGGSSNVPPALNTAKQTVTPGLEVTDPATTLTSLRSSPAGVQPALAAVPRPSAAAPMDLGLMPGAFVGAGAGTGMDMGMASAARMQTVLVETDDTWTDARPVTAVLGREPQEATWDEEPR